MKLVGELLAMLTVLFKLSSDVVYHDLLKLFMVTWPHTGNHTFSWIL